MPLNSALRIYNATTWTEVVLRIIGKEEKVSMGKNKNLFRVGNGKTLYADCRLVTVRQSFRQQKMGSTSSKKI